MSWTRLQVGVTKRKGREFQAIPATTRGCQFHSPLCYRDTISMPRPATDATPWFPGPFAISRRREIPLTGLLRMRHAAWCPGEYHAAGYPTNPEASSYRTTAPPRRRATDANQFREPFATSLPQEILPISSRLRGLPRKLVCSQPQAKRRRRIVQSSCSSFQYPQVRLSDSEPAVQDSNCTFFTRSQGSGVLLRRPSMRQSVSAASLRQMGIQPSGCGMYIFVRAHRT